MNCFYHPELIAVGTCQDCRKGLCSGCASKYTFLICSQCNENRLEIEKFKIRKEFNQYITAGVLTLLFNIFVVYKLSLSSLEDGLIDNIALSVGLGLGVLMLIYYVPSIVAGWKTLGSLTSRGFITLPIIGWLIYVWLKLMMASIIGPVMLPIRIYKNIKRLKELKEISKINAQPIQNI